MRLSEGAPADPNINSPRHIKMPNSSVSPQQMAGAIRALAMDAVQKAKSGHPGMPLGMADIAVALWTRHLRHNPADPKWLGRDRFILSNGHGSMLQYALLHLTGYDLTMDDLKAFRQLGSRTPGHPEYGVTAGVETSTGPLGQGIANGVGMALAEKMLAAEFNRPGFPVINNRTYVFLGDGCMMEGVSHEACSLAGVWQLGKLIALYDDNGISIDGDVKGWFGDDTRKRFEAYGWKVIGPVNGHDIDCVDRAIAEAEAQDEKPTLIICKTTIGKGSPKLQGTAKVHGAPMGEEEIAATKKAIGWEHGPFEVPQEIYDAFDAKAAGAKMEAEYQAMFARYEEQYPELAAELKRRIAGDLPANYAQVVADAVESAKQAAETVATRKASQKALSAICPKIPEMLGGSADLTGSNLTNWAGVEAFSLSNMAGRHISYGVREFGMTAIMNGIALYGGYIPFAATFLTFSDYAKNGIRMAALMKIRSIFVYTHDSIGVGEDGPTHQPIEHVASLRLIPGLDVWRPCDTVEAAAAWGCAIGKKDGPSALIFSRQNAKFLHAEGAKADEIVRGGYVLEDAENPKAVIVATGTEVQLAVDAKALLAAEGIPVRVVSMPCAEIFDAQDEAYRDAVLPKGLPVLTVEAGSTALWAKYLRGNGASIGIDSFGASAPAGKLWPLYGITAEAAAARVKDLIK